MLRQLSRSVLIMFLFDLIILTLLTIFWCTKFGLREHNLAITVIITVTVGIVVLFLKENYKVREFNITLKNTYLLFEGLVFAHIPLFTSFMLTGSFISAAKYTLLNLITTFILLRLYRAFFHIYLFKYKRTKNVLIIGTNANAKLIADEIINKKALKMDVIGLVQDEHDNEEYIQDNKYKIFTYPYNLKEIIKNNEIDIVIVAIERRMQEALLTDMVTSIPNSTKLYKMAEFYEMVTGRYFIDRMSINWLFYDYMKNRSFIYDILKRTFDIVAASIILTVTFPILLYIGIRIKLTDGGNIIYTQTRIGKNGKEFKAYKLRTMYANDFVPKKGANFEYAESQNVDDRVIPFCKFVRKARFDEIPQMINILKGEMSIVGPRTEWDKAVNIYTEEVPYYVCRMWVKTGWTGWAQINQGHCCTIDDESQKLSYDLYYLRHRNVVWEIGILIKAVFLALGGRHG